MALQHLRSSTAHKRPIPTVMSAGQIAINTNEASPALFFKDSNGDLVKVGPVHIGPDAPNSSPASVAATALVTGTVYQILTVGTSDFTLVGASANTVGTIFTATGTTTGTGTVSGQQGVEKGEQWLDNSGGTYVLKIYDGTAWRSESGTFVDVSGDTMTGALLLDNAASASAPDLSFDGDADTGVYSPGANQFAIATGGNGRVFIDSSGNVGIGTLNPEEILNIAAASEAVNTRDGVILQSTSGLAANTGLPLVFTSHIGNVANYGVASIAGRKENATSGNAAGYLQFATGSSGGSISEKMRIDSAGRLLVGTPSAPTPATTLVLKGNSGSTNTQGRVHIQRSAVPADGDFMGDINFMDTSDGVSGSIGVARDGGTWTAGSSTPGRLMFSTTASGENSPTERMRITSDGEMQMGDPSTNGGWRVFVSDQGTVHQRGRMLFRAKSGTASTQEVLQIYNGTSEQLRITANGNIANANNSYGSLSDVKLKENIVDANSQWADIKDLRVRNYNFIEGQTHTQIGLVAQEVELVSPGLVNESPDTDDEGNDLGTVTKSVKYSVLYMKAVKALQEAMERIEVLEQRLSDAGIA